MLVSPSVPNQTPNLAATLQAAAQSGAVTVSTAVSTAPVTVSVGAGVTTGSGVPTVAAVAAAAAASAGGVPGSVRMNPMNLVTMDPSRHPCLSQFAATAGEGRDYWRLILFHSIHNNLDTTLWLGSIRCHSVVSEAAL